jgi:hypothetical protein
MSTRFTPPGDEPTGSSNARDSRLIDDAAALVRLTGERLPKLHETVRGARLRSTPSEGFVTRTRTLFGSRPLLAPALAGLLAVALLVVPVSYQKTVGWNVTLDVTGGSSAGIAGLPAVGRDAVGAESANLNLDGNHATVTARVPLEAGKGVATRAAALARVLTAEGFTAKSSVEPIRESVSGNLFAMTRDGTIRVDITAEGRTPAEIESQVRDQLAAAGITNAEVTVTKDDKQHTTIQVMAHPDGSGAENAALPHDFEFSVDGKGPGDGSQAKVVIDNSGHQMTDAQIKQSIEDQLRAQGHPAVVDVSGGKVLKVTPIKN